MKDERKFWDNQFNNIEPIKIERKYFPDCEFFNQMKLMTPNKVNVLDYGTGTGWALFDLYYVLDINHGVGIDTSINAINYDNACAKMSNMKNLEFIQGDENKLDEFKDYFDFAVSVNTLDVVDDNTVEAILGKIKSALKKNAYFIVCINPDFPKEFIVEKLQMEIKGHYYYKDGYLRCNYKTKEEWIETFSKYFEFVEYKVFNLGEFEKEMKRQAFVLKKI